MESKFTLHFLFFITVLFFNFNLSAQEDHTSECKEPVVNAEIVPACPTGNSGQINLVINQGLPPYQALWDDGSTALNRKVSQGNYQVQVTDALGCKVSNTFNVPTFDRIQISVQVDHNVKKGKKTGAINLMVTGGQPPYHYSWISNSLDPAARIDPGSNQLKKLLSGNYKAMVFDAAGCYMEIQTEVK